MRRLGLIAAFVLTAAAAADAGAETALEIYQKPAAVVSDGKLYLFLRLAGDEDGSRCLCLRGDGRGEWTRLGEFRANYTAITHSGGKFFLFLSDLVVELSGPDCNKTGEVRWPFNWKAQSAEVIDGKLVAFGVREGKLYSAAAAPPPGDAGDGLKDGPAASAATLPQHGWVESPIMLDQDKARTISTILVGNSLWIFWSTSPKKGQGETLWAGVLLGSEVQDASAVAASETPIAFAPASLSREPVIIFTCTGPPVRLGDRNPLTYRRYRRGIWQPYETAPGVANFALEWTRDICAASQDDTVHLFLATGLRVLTASFDGVSWTPVERVVADPAADWVFEHAEILGGILLAAALLLLASLARSRRLPRRAVIGGVEYTLAAWWRRAAAYLADLFITAAAVTVMHMLADRPFSTASWFAGAFAFEIFYLTVSEARSGKTLGKRLLGVIVVSRNGGYPTWSESALRNLPRIFTDAAAVFPMLLIGSLFILNTRGSQRVGDLLAGTYVVRERKQR